MTFELSRHKLVNKAQRLTDRIWTNISPDLLDFMDETKQSRLTSEKRSARLHRCNVLVESRRSYLCSQPLGIILPPAVDIAIMRPFARVIEEGIEEEHNLQAVFTETDFAHAWKKFPGLHSRWYSSIVVNMIASNSSVEQESDLYLATRTFKGPSDCCASGWRFPGILSHACTARLNAPEGSAGRIAASMGKRSGLAVAAAFRVSHDKNAEKLVSLCRLDPSTATYEDMMSANPLFECRGCKNFAGRRIMNYPAAVSLWRCACNCVFLICASISSLTCR